MKMMPNSKRYRYEIEYFMTNDSAGKYKKKKEVEFTKLQNEWKRSEWETLAKFLQAQEHSRKCDISIIAVKPIGIKNN